MAQQALRIELDRLDRLSDDEVLLDLFSEVIQAAGPMDNERRIRLARAWVDGQIDALRDTVCLHPATVALLASGTEVSTLEVAVVVGDLLTDVLGGVAAAAVALLVARRGLERLCG